MSSDTTKRTNIIAQNLTPPPPASLAQPQPSTTYCLPLPSPKTTTIASPRKPLMHETSPTSRTPSLNRASEDHQLKPSPSPTIQMPASFLPVGGAFTQIKALADRVDALEKTIEAKNDRIAALERINSEHTARCIQATEEIKRLRFTDLEVGASRRSPGRLPKQERRLWAKTKARQADLAFSTRTMNLDPDHVEGYFVAYMATLHAYMQPSALPPKMKQQPQFPGAPYPLPPQPYNFYGAPEQASFQYGYPGMSMPQMPPVPMAATPSLCAIHNAPFPCYMCRSMR
ncbi:hypothetical protein K504DRAFT_463361 [Pleomassaria siparia CBS 279.74]|uniref:Uncharacterized protein n=1 Tax=Pleomassaria siparia CBS 279.74 TaxID=1314801 RepID=A0A6G1JTI6_9PLEO|nr:hypothetical protein K504DRAFT_463361 [Pleomassaria siparia CBS 279.74]